MVVVCETWHLAVDWGMCRLGESGGTSNYSLSIKQRANIRSFRESQLRVTGDSQSDLVIFYSDFLIL